ncbi:MAG: hypothetical protein IPM29_27525 [Planctomycetes bacterium]|nr:hypothetical protein [Planctomycetota bacterium]
MSLRLLWAIPTLGTLALAQSRGWDLPPHGAALFDQTRRLEVRPPEPGVAGLPVLDQAGILFADDLDRRGERIDAVPLSLVELVPFLALDLSSARGARAVKLDLPALAPAGLLRLDGDWSRPDERGVQTFDGRLTSVDRVRGGRFELDPRSAPWHRCTLRAQLGIERLIEASTGRVARFSLTLRGELGRSDDRAAPTQELLLEETWTFRELTSADGAFKERVAKAIVAGRERLLRGLDEHLGGLQPMDWEKGGGVDHIGGELALVLLTLVKAGLPCDDELLQRGFRELRAREHRDSYTLGVALMALEALYADPNERDHLASGLLDRPQPRDVPAEDRALMTEWAQRLLGNRDSSVDPAYLSRWTYTGGPYYDNSNTQYALLGLYSASLCGVEITPTVWWAAGKHFVTAQCPLEAPARLSLLTHRQVDRLAAGDRPTSTGLRIEPAGWSYRGPDEPPYASMTAGGVSSLTICLAALRGMNARGEGIRDMEIARQRGLAWLAVHHTVRRNEGHPDPDAWHFYHLYGLERACELGQIARLDEHDWYFEGATLLCEHQNPDGSFRFARLEDDCFAILFLKKASLPVYTGGR